MIDYLGLDNVVYGILIALFFAAYAFDKFSKHTLKHIDMLQDRIDMLEERLGIKE